MLNPHCLLCLVYSSIQAETLFLHFLSLKPTPFIFAFHNNSKFPLFQLEPPELSEGLPQFTSTYFKTPGETDFLCCKFMRLNEQQSCNQKGRMPN